MIPSSAATIGLTPARLVGRCALMGVILGVAAVLIAAGVHRGFDASAFVAAAIAWGVCWTGASLALAATYVGGLLQAPVQGMLVSMMGRIGLPLASLVVLPQVGGAAAAPGVMTTILGVYLIALVVETVLALQMVPRSTTPGVSAPGAAKGV